MQAEKQVLYVVHYTKLVDRRNSILKIFSKSNFKVEWVTEKNFLKINQTYSDRKTVYGVTKSLIGMDLGVNSRSLVFSRRRARFQGWILLLRSKIEYNKSLIRGSLPSGAPLSSAWLEVQQMHISALKKGIQSKDDWIIILEDDAIVLNSFQESIQWVNQTFKPTERIWLNLNSGADLRSTSSDPAPDLKGFYRVKPASTRCAVGYVVSKKLAFEMIQLIEKEGLPNWLPIDLIFQVLLRALKAKSFWQDPPSIVQGSESGRFQSGFEEKRK